MVPNVSMFNVLQVGRISLQYVRSNLRVWNVCLLYCTSLILIWNNMTHHKTQIFARCPLRDTRFNLNACRNTHRIRMQLTPSG